MSYGPVRRYCSNDKLLFWFGPYGYSILLYYNCKSLIQQKYMPGLKATNLLLYLMPIMASIKTRNMRFFYLLLLTCMAFTVFSCQSGGDKNVRDEARESVEQQAPTPNTTTQQPGQLNQNAAVNSGVPHYQCPQGCKGGEGPSKGACPVCGTEMAHNQAYHNQQPQQNTANPTITTQPNSSNPSITPPPNVQTQQRPAQNAAGEYHYTCPKGCSGGAGAAGSCGQCGATLAHNQAYHN